MKYKKSGHADSGAYARTPKGFKHNVKHMEKEGFSEKRAVGTAYGEADRSMRKKNGHLSYDQLQAIVKSL